MININYVNGDRHSRVYNGRQLATVMGQEGHLPLSAGMDKHDNTTHHQSSQIEVKFTNSYNSQGEPADRRYPCNTIYKKGLDSSSEYVV